MGEGGAGLMAQTETNKRGKMKGIHTTYLLSMNRRYYQNTQSHLFPTRLLK